MRIRRVFFLVVGVATFAGYVLVFGELGYLRQSYIKSDLERMRSEVRGLEQENAGLTEQYQRMLDRVEGSGRRPASRDLRHATILKFEEHPGDATGPESPARTVSTGLSGGQERISLEEARALYLVAMLFLAVVGYALIRHFEVARQGD